MSIIFEIEEYLKNFPIGHIFKSNEIKKELSKKYNRPQSSYILSDYSYNIINFPFFNSYGNRPHYFIQKENGTYEYVGKFFQGKCEVLYKQQQLCGNWNKGIFTPNETFFNISNTSKKIYEDNKIFTKISTNEEKESLNTNIENENKNIYKTTEKRANKNIIKIIKNLVNKEFKKIIKLLKQETSINIKENTEMNIFEVINKLSKKHPIYTCEVEFQFYLAWEIKEQYKNNYEIIWEHPIQINNGNCYLDLLLVDKYGGHIPIELKYRTKTYERKIGNHIYKLKNQGAEDISRYSYLKDIERIEFMKKYDPNFSKGFAIIITNQNNVWDKAPSENEIAYEFSLKDKSKILKGEKKYRSTSEKFLKDYPNLYIENTYKIDWIDYSNFKDKNGCFKVLITEINKDEN